MAAAFEHDGRWSLLSLSAYFVLAAFADRTFWHLSPVSWNAALFVPLIALPLVFLKTRSRRAQAVLTWAYLALSVAAAAAFSPWSYR